MTRVCLSQSTSIHLPLVWRTKLGSIPAGQSRKVDFGGNLPATISASFRPFDGDIVQHKFLLSVNMFCPSFSPWVDVNFENYEQQKERLCYLHERYEGYWDSPESNPPIDLDEEIEFFDLKSAIGIFERVHLKIAA